MAHYTDLKKELARYSRTYRNPRLPPLELSGLYALFPENHKTLPKGVTGHWPDDDWPNGDEAGVYIFLGSKFNLLYIGKTSLLKLKDRLSAYFRYGDLNRCRIPDEHGWTEKPEFVVTIGILAKTAFESAALEEYLISRLQPSQNTIGIK